MRRHLIRAAQSLAGSFGYAALPKWRIPNLTFATRLRDIFEHQGIDTVIDVGANEGGYYDFLRNEVRFSGRIESYEPVPEIAGRLRLRASSDPLWSIHACALGAKIGELALNVMASSDFSSFHEPLKIGSADQILKNTVVRKVTVPVQTLDAELEGCQQLGRCYLKLDTQGFDLEVLRGAVNNILQIRALQTEISFRGIYKGMPDYKEAIAEFEKHGFSVADMFLVSKDEMGRALEFDCVMVRNGA